MSNRTIASPVAAETAEATITAYIQSWNETDAGRRRAVIARAWAPAGLYRDPVMASDGPAEIDAMLEAVQARFPGFVLKRTSPVDSHVAAGERYVRFTWSLGPEAGPAVVEGVDFCALDGEGRLRSVVGFIDKMPAA